MDNDVGWIGFDLDGTLAEYTGWTGPYKIGKPIPAIVEKVKYYMEKGIPCKIFTARVSMGMQDRDLNMVIGLIKSWCYAHIGFELPVTNIKDISCVCIYDDRAVAVEANTGKILGGKEVD